MPRQFLEEEGKQKCGLSPWAAVVWVFQSLGLSPDLKSPSTASPGIQIPLITDLQHDDRPDKMEPGLWQRSQSKYEAAAFSAACEIAYRGCSQGANREGNRGTGLIQSPQPTAPAYGITQSSRMLSSMGAMRVLTLALTVADV